MYSNVSQTGVWGWSPQPPVAMVVWGQSPQPLGNFCKFLEKKTILIPFFFNRFACFWPKGYQLGSLGKSHQNGDYLKEAMRKIVFPQESNLQPLDYRSTALPLELEKTPPRMLNFGYLNPATCLLYDCNNKSIKMFLFFFNLDVFFSKNILIDLLF